MMIKDELDEFYRAYIACLNERDWRQLGQFVDDDVRYNDELIRLSGYREMLERDVSQIPDLAFKIQLLLSDPPRIASRLSFDCSPTGTFVGLHVDGRRVTFTENVFYEIRRGKIGNVWSVIDKAAIEAQLAR